MFQFLTVGDDGAGFHLPVELMVGLLDCPKKEWMASGSPSTQSAEKRLLGPAQTEFLGDCQVARVIRASQVGQCASALTHHFQQTAPARFIVFVDAQVLGQLGDALGQDGNLHIRRTGIAFVQGEVGDRLRLFFLFEWHDVCFSFRAR